MREGGQAFIQAVLIIASLETIQLDNLSRGHDLFPAIGTDADNLADKGGQACSLGCAGIVACGDLHGNGGETTGKPCEGLCHVVPRHYLALGTASYCIGGIGSIHHGDEVFEPLKIPIAHHRTETRGGVGVAYRLAHFVGKLAAGFVGAVGLQGETQDFVHPQGGVRLEVMQRARDEERIDAAPHRGTADKGVGIVGDR